MLLILLAAAAGAGAGFGIASVTSFAIAPAVGGAAGIVIAVVAIPWLKL